ncbi:MAG: hypothetical protein ABIQ95_14835, partial [Bdellovibrionia bacterium]
MSLSTANQTQFNVTGLSDGTYAFAVLVKDLAGNKSLYLPVSAEIDITAPTIGGVISGTPTTTQVNLSWPAATDSITAAASLQYKVTRASSTSTINTVSGADAATLVTDWTSNLTATSATGLSSSTTYAFAVLVKDAAGNKALYAPISSTTASAGPTVGTAITLNSVSRVTTFSSSASLSWGVGSDSGTDTADLQYKVVIALQSSDIDTAAKADTCASPCSIVTNWTANLTATNLTGLANVTRYQVAVVVKNDGGLKALYSPLAVVTPAYGAELNTSTGTYRVLTRTTSDQAQVVRSSGSAWTQVGANFGSNITDDIVSIVKTDSGELQALVRVYQCNGWVYQSQIYRFLSGTWTAFSGMLGGTQVHCN